MSKPKDQRNCVAKKKQATKKKCKEKDLIACKKKFLKAEEES